MYSASTPHGTFMEDLHAMGTDCPVAEVSDCHSYTDEEVQGGTSTTSPTLLVGR